MHLTDKIATIESISRDVAAIARLGYAPVIHVKRIQYNCQFILKDYIEAENSNARRDALVRRADSNTAWIVDRPSDTEAS